ncbi:flagellar basal body P-ring biosynthesis protein FlgA [Thalassoglobus neptunius]|uniref:Flagellar basal body P-ring biosynthesis protein FlgA n=1 Tax=Thalassoglobus neptunius TaxID=1938619 RepID=A0A5C5VWM3_9PLAN|nr:flagellar basal body P-ring formation chaperone FlgA [Thalassoglobus neptunius]TWT43018.1 flagellar basal body P-ring biosynthesis protein FlgA [Thalassoglobus neptunius]
MLKPIWVVTLVANMIGMVNLAHAQQDAPLCLRLLPDVKVLQPVVRLVDVVDTAPELLPEELRHIDLCQVEQSGSTITLDRRLIDLRLALCSVDRGIVLVGATECQVQRIESAELTEASLEQSARLEVARISGCSPDDVQVKVIQPVFRGRRPEVPSETPLRFDFEFPRHQIWGRRLVQVRALCDEDLIWSDRVPMVISRQRRVLTARMDIPRDEIVSPEMFEMKSLFDFGGLQSPTFEQVIGKRTVKMVEAGTVVTVDDLVDVQPVNRDVVIHVRDAVRLVAETRGLRFVVPRAQAMQTGRVGQLIRVKNLESNRIVTARVVGAGEAVVDLK